MEKRRAIVTGAYGAIGKAIAEGMVRAGYDTVLVGRNEQELKQLAEKLKQKTKNDAVGYHVVDLSDKQQIEAFAQGWQGPLHVLINNAATTPRSRQEASDGTELQFAVNVLGYFRMIKHFAPFMEGVEDARIVNVASNWAGDLDLDDPEFTKRPYNNDTAYRQSKQADRMLTLAFAERLSPQNIAVLANHPGDVNSKLSNNLGYGGMTSPADGAATPLYCALDPSLKGVSGKYFVNRQESPDRFASDRKAIERLWEICEGKG